MAGAAESKRPIAGVKLTSPPTIDGDLADAAWQSASKASGFTDLQNGNPVFDQTEAWIGYDDQFIYVAFRCNDSKPEGIVARETVRDSKYSGDRNQNPNREDNVQINFDPFLTFQDDDVSRFSVNAIGTRSASIAGGRAAKAEWKGDWDAAVKRDDRGWTCEIRIPWASLNYPSSARPVTMGINFQRFQDRTKTLSIWSNTTSQDFTNLEGLWTGVEPPQTGFRRTLSLLPYVLGGDIKGELSGKAGLDMRYTLTPQLTAVGSINPDFSTIQGAIQSIAFSHSERFVPDQRPFFTEGGGNFYAQTNINDIGAFFYSNRIKTFDVGAKLYGKLSAKDTLGVLNTYSYDGRNDLVARYTTAYNETDSGGGMLVHTNAGGIENTNLVIDQHFRKGKMFLEGVGAHSSGQGAGGGAQVVNAYYADKYFLSCIQYSGVSNNFLTPIGFVPFKGYHGMTAIEYWGSEWREGRFRSSNVTLVGLDWKQNDGAPFFKGHQGEYNLDTRDDWRFKLKWASFDFLGEKDNVFGFGVTKGVTNRFAKIGFQVDTGKLGSAKTTAFSPFFSLRVFKKLDVLYSGLIQNREGVDQQHILTVNYEISPIKSFGGRLVTHNGDTNAYLFFRRSGEKGTDFYLVLGDPNAKKTVSSIQIKMVFAYQS